MKKLFRLLLNLVLFSSIFSTAFTAHPAPNLQFDREQLRIGRGTADTIAWHPDGTQLAVGGSLGVWIYDTDFQELVHFDRSPERVVSLSWHPSGTILAIGTSEQTTLLWHVDNGKIETIYEGGDDIYRPMLHNQYVVAWSPDGTRLATGEKTGLVRLWNANTSETVILFEDSTIPVQTVYDRVKVIH